MVFVEWKFVHFCCSFITPVNCCPAVQCFIILQVLIGRHPVATVVLHWLPCHGDCELLCVVMYRTHGWRQAHVYSRPIVELAQRQSGGGAVYHVALPQIQLIAKILHTETKSGSCLRQLCHVTVPWPFMLSTVYITDTVLRASAD